MISNNMRSFLLPRVLRFSLWLQWAAPPPRVAAGAGTTAPSAAALCADDGINSEAFSETAIVRKVRRRYHGDQKQGEGASAPIPWLEEGQRFINKKKWMDAVEMYLQMIKAEPFRPDAWHLYAAAHFGYASDLVEKQKARLKAPSSQMQMQGPEDFQTEMAVRVSQIRRSLREALAAWDVAFLQDLPANERNIMKPHYAQAYSLLRELRPSAAEIGFGGGRSSQNDENSNVIPPYDCLLEGGGGETEQGAGAVDGAAPKRGTITKSEHQDSFSSEDGSGTCGQMQLGLTIAWALRAENVRDVYPTAHIADKRFLSKQASGMDHRLLGGVHFLCGDEAHLTFTFTRREKTYGVLSARTMRKILLVFWMCAHLPPGPDIMCGVVHFRNGLDPRMVEYVAREQRTHFRSQQEGEKTKALFEKIQGFTGDWAKSDKSGLLTEVELSQAAPRSTGRYEVRLPLEEPFTCPSLIGNKLLLSFLTSVLKPKIEIDIRGPGDGPRGIMDEFSYVQSDPKTPPMHWHQDVDPVFSTQVFVEGEAQPLPPAAIVMVVPLRDLTRKDGPTEFLTGSHVHLPPRHFWSESTARLTFAEEQERAEMKARAATVVTASGDIEDTDESSGDGEDSEVFDSAASVDAGNSRSVNRKTGEKNQNKERTAGGKTKPKASKGKKNAKGSSKKKQASKAGVSTTRPSTAPAANIAAGVPPRVSFEASKGAVTFMDLRLHHRALPNSSDLPRAVLYISYVRDWFKDAANFKELHSQRLDTLPSQAMKKLLMRVETRTHTEAMAEVIEELVKHRAAGGGVGGVQLQEDEMTKPSNAPPRGRETGTEVNYEPRRERGGKCERQCKNTTVDERFKPLSLSMIGEEDPERGGNQVDEARGSSSRSSREVELQEVASDIIKFLEAKYLSAGGAGTTGGSPPTPVVAPSNRTDSISGAAAPATKTASSDVATSNTNSIVEMLLQRKDVLPAQTKYIQGNMGIWEDIEYGGKGGVSRQEAMPLKT